MRQYIYVLYIFCYITWYENSQKYSLSKNLSTPLLYHSNSLILSLTMTTTPKRYRCKTPRIIARNGRLSRYTQCIYWRTRSPFVCKYTFTQNGVRGRSTSVSPNGTGGGRRPTFPFGSRVL